MLGRILSDLFHCYMAVIMGISNPSFYIQFFEMFQNKGVVFELCVSFTVNAYSCNEFIITDGYRSVAINAWQHKLVHIQMFWHWSIIFKPLTIWIKTFHFKYQNMWSFIKEFLREKSIIKAVLTCFFLCMNIKVFFYLMSGSS